MEKLYNNILLPDDAFAAPSDAEHLPYLENPPEVIDVSVGRQLFVDNFLIADTTLAPVYHTAKKYAGNPILAPETPWEIAQSPVACPKSGGVFYDEKEKIYKMWYEGGWLRGMCYATSHDGIRWERPDLGIVPGTNQILPYEGYEPHKYFAGADYTRSDSTTVWIDDDAPESERYKLFLRNPGGKSPGFVAVSADGWHFRDFRETSELFDRSTVFYNPFRKKWVYSIRDVWQGRSRTYRECDDLLAGAKWSEDQAHHWLACDDKDLPDPYIGFPPQLYNVDCVGYESILLGMFQIMQGPENDACEKRGVPKITELIPMYSRDGYHFSRPCRRPIIPAERVAGKWDRGYVQSVGGVLIPHGDECYIYYIGFAGDETHAGEDWITNGIYRNGATGLATIRRDGFVSMEGEGTLTTRQILYNGKESLHINASGRIGVELLTADGTLLARAEDFVGDATDARLTLPEDAVAKQNGKPIRLRFTVKGALYAFGFFDKNNSSGGAHAAGFADA